MRIISGLSGIVFLGFLMAGCQPEATSSAPEIRPVRTEVVDPKPIPDDRQAIGDIRPRQESDIGFRIAGKLIARKVNVGDTVKKGDLIASLDDQDYQNRRRSAEADLSAASAAWTEAQATEARLKQLLAKGVTTQANYYAAVKNLRAAEAQRDSATAALSLASDQLGYGSLHADSDGIITAVGAEPGQVVNIGQMVVRLALPDEKDAVFAVAESAFRGLAPGEHPTVHVTLLSDPAIKADGLVREVSPVADPATRTFAVKVTLENAPLQMRFGSSIHGQLVIPSPPMVTLPAGSITDQSGKPAVWVFQSTDQTVKLVPVTVERYESGKVIIRDGLAKGDVVVTAGANHLREGQKVRLLEGAGE